MAEDSKTKTTFLEIFKVLSTVISTFVLAVGGWVVTIQYNQKQLEIAQIKEISNLIPKLGSENEKERKYSAIALGLYGEAAIPALISALEDSEAVGEACARSLALIGGPAIPAIERAIVDKRNSEMLRGNALTALAVMKEPKSLVFAKEYLPDQTEPPKVRAYAAGVIGMLKDSESIDLLVKALNDSQYTDIYLSRMSVWSLGQIAHPSTSDILLSLLSSTQDEELLVQVTMALSNFKSKDVSDALAALWGHPNERVRGAAKTAFDLQKRIREQPKGVLLPPVKARIIQ